MEHIKKYLKESISTDLKNKLLDIINGDGLDQRAAIQMINIGKYSGKLGFNTGEYEENEVQARYTRGKNKGELKFVSKSRGKNKVITPVMTTVRRELLDEDKYGFSKWLDNINISNNRKEQISHILIDNDMMDSYINYIESPYLDTQTLINNGNPSNIFKLLKNTNINIKTLKSISFLEDNIGNINQGKYEILLKMFLNDLNDHNNYYDPKHHGDIQSGGVAIEIKGENARPNGQKQHPAEKIYTKLQSILDKDGKNYKVEDNVLNSEKRINTFIMDLFNLYQDDNKVFDVLFKGIKAQYDDGSDLQINIDRKYLCKKIFNKGKVNKINGESGVTRLMMSIQLHFYQLEEGFNYLCLINPINGDYICVNENQFEVDKIFDNFHIACKTGVGGRSTGVNRDNYCQIFYR